MTKAEANKEAKAALKLMPAEWTIHVWNDINNTWAWCLIYAKGLITIYPDKHTNRYMAMADMVHPFCGSAENWGKSDYFGHPRSAVEDILERIEMKVVKLGHFAKTVRNAAGYLKGAGV